MSHIEFIMCVNSFNIMFKAFLTMVIGISSCHAETRSPKPRLQGLLVITQSLLK